MTGHRWAAQSAPTELGVIAHGPHILSRADGIAAGLRCVFGHTQGLQVVIAVHATGVHAEAASRQSFTQASRGDVDPHRHSGPLVHFELDGLEGDAEPSQTSASGGDDVFDLEATFWIGRIPHDGQLAVSITWPEAGLPEGRTQLTLEGLDDPTNRPLPLT